MKKRCGVWMVCLLSAVVAGTDPAAGVKRVQHQGTSETVLYFPDYVDGGGWAVQLVLSNIDPDEAASVEVEVFDQEGRSVSGFFDSETTLEIPPLGSRVMHSTGQGSIRRGWIQVQIQSASVRGLLTYRDTQTGIEVGVEPVPLSDSFALFVEETGATGTGLAIFKPDAPSKIAFQIWDEAGKNPIGGDLVWGDFKQRARTIPEWFEEVDQEFLEDFRGLLFLDAEDGSPFAPIGLRFGKTGNHSLSAVPAIQEQMEEPMKTTLYFPDYVVGGGWAVQLVLSNVDPDEAASIVVEVHDQQGHSVPGFFDAGNRLEIPPLGSQVWYSTGEASIRRGWVQIQSQTASVRGLLTYRDTQTGIEVGVEPVPLSDSFALFVEETGAIGTGLAIFKPDAPSEIEFQIRDEAGDVPIGGGLARGDFKQRAQTIPEWFAGIDQTFLRDHRGLLLLRTEDGSSFAPLGLRFGKQGNLSLAAVPAIRIMDEDGIEEEPSRPPTVTMTVSSNSIEWGQSATLSWSATDAVSATITPGIGDVPTSGSIKVSPTSTTTYRITVLGADGPMDTARASARVTVVISERAALVALNHATGGLNWTLNENWLTDRPLREWSGVDVDGQGRVIRLDLVNNGLTGTIPSELGSLTNLRSLHLSANGLTGAIPAELGSLANLETLELSNNELTGSIPEELGLLANLESLALSNNGLTGSIPAELGSLANLRTLELGTNFLTGSIPGGLGSLANLEILNLFGNQLMGPIPEELGSLASLEFLHLSNNDLAGPIPEELGSLANLEILWLSQNHLTGQIPEELGSLANLDRLLISYNDVEGPVPSSFLDLDLDQFRFNSNDRLCVPGTSAFVRWSKEISNFRGGAFCNDADRAILEVLHEVTDGSSWTYSAGWRGVDAVGDWYGVTVDSLGRVTSLNLSDNGLDGRLPGNLALLSRLTELRIDGNALSGRLPLSLSSLRLLREFRYVDTNLCVPTGESFSAWLDTIPLREGTGVECAPPSERDIVMALYDATYGPNWTNNENWLTDRPLGEWFGIEVDDQGRVIRLNLSRNRLKGPIPKEFGSLTNLQGLLLHENGLTGPIPKELGSLTNLESLLLLNNDLTGPIPPELGSLTNLRSLWLPQNNLTGPIPKELGSLTNLEGLLLEVNDLTGPIPPDLGLLTNLDTLWLGSNNLTGPIPGELGALANLRTLGLSYNNLTGPIPGELGSLTNLEGLFLSDNDLTGPIPESLAGLESLQVMILSRNARMSGALPTRLTNLRRLEELLVGDTGLCAPSDAKFRDWLDDVWKQRVALCNGGDPPQAYLTQAAQSQESSVPLVAGEDALVRVFVTAPGETDHFLPPVRVRFYLNGTESYVADIPRTTAPISSEFKEGDLAASANALIPGHVVQPGLEMVIEIDPQGTLGFNSSVAKRIPKRGGLKVDVRAMPVFDLVIVPFLWSPDPDSAVLELVTEMARDPGGHSLLRLTRTLLPIGELSVSAHESVLTKSNNARDLLRETEAIRVMEGASGHYMGTMTGQFRGVDGLALTYGWSIFAKTDRGDRSKYIIAHELGHNVGLHHPPGCGAKNTDFSYPHQLGTIGVWGYDFHGSGRLVPPNRPDLMSYCGRTSKIWISDYHFANALRFRLRSAVTGGPSSLVAARSITLMVWGGTDAGGSPFLESAFVVEAPTVLPGSAGDYELTGKTAAGDELFVLRFDMPEISDSDGGSSFVFALPIQPEWADELAGITLSGPGGAVTLDKETDRPTTILRNPRTGQIRGILRGLSPRDLSRDEALDALSSDPRMEILTSSGLPDPEDWTR